MRRRWAAVGAAILLCLAAGGTPVAAQSDAVVVSVTQKCDINASPIACTWTASDPRVAGSGGHVFVEGESGHPGFIPPGTDVALHWTDYWIEGPEGAWTGHSYLVTDDAGVVHTLTMLAGEGAYEGWSFVAYGADPEADADYNKIGVLYDGPLPPVGAVVMPGTD